MAIDVESALQTGPQASPSIDHKQTSPLPNNHMSIALPIIQPNTRASINLKNKQQQQKPPPTLLHP
jgi:hypothetical protein